MKLFTQLLCVLLFLFYNFSWSATVKDRQGAVLQDRERMEKSGRWIYNDIEIGFKKAKEQNKPLLVTFRCVPCLACIGMDTEVLLENSQISFLLDQFICLRIINANKLDLTKFQFDYDLSFSVLTFNPDGTLYNRFGSWKHQKDPQDKTTESFESALKGALAIHSDYPKNKALLLGKQGKPHKYKSPLSIPGIKGKFKEELDWNGQVVRSCVHCHQINDSLNWHARDRKLNLAPEQIYPYPSCEILGLTLGNEFPLRAEKISSDSPADLAGFKKGDQILQVSGQFITTEADMSWALHNIPNSVNEIPILVQRASRKGILKVKLSSNWKNNSDISRRVGTWTKRALAFGGMKLEEIDNSTKRSFGLRSDSLALEAKHVGQYNKHALAKRAGWKKGDILIEVEGRTDRMTESQLIGWILERRRPGQNLNGVAIRSGKKIKLTIPVQ